MFHFKAAFTSLILKNLPNSLIHFHSSFWGASGNTSFGATNAKSTHMAQAKRKLTQTYQKQDTAQNAGHKLGQRSQGMYGAQDLKHRTTALSSTAGTLWEYLKLATCCSCCSASLTTFFAFSYFRLPDKLTVRVQFENMLALRFCAAREQGQDIAAVRVKAYTRY